MQLVGKRIPGTCCDGTILFVDDDGTMFVEFDNGDEALVYVREGELQTPYYKHDRFVRPERSVQLRQGQRVMAAWEPQWYYAGTVRFVNPRSGRAYIRFDDGDRGIKKPDQIKPINIEVGTKVECRFYDGATYYAGTIKRKRGDLVIVQYDDRRLEESWVPWSMVRVSQHAIGLPENQWLYCFSDN